MKVVVLGSSRMFLTAIPEKSEQNTRSSDRARSFCEALLPGLREMHAGGYALGLYVSESNAKQGNYDVIGEPEPIALSTFWTLCDEEQQPDLSETRYCADDIVRAIQAIKCIPSDDRDVWMMVGRAFHHATSGTEEGLEIWTQWSTQSRKFGRREQRRQWRAFKDGKANPTTLASVFELARECGWTEERKASLSIDSGLAAIPQSIGISAKYLAGNTMQAVRQRFAEWKHDPSPAQWDALTDLAAHLEAMADGSAKPMYYLSSLDPGVGKTQTISHFMNALQRSPEHKDVGVIVFVGRRQEISSFIHSMDLNEQDYAVGVSENDPEGAKLNQLGNPLPDKARLLFTTQQMLEARTKSRSEFESIEAFYFRGKPRTVRIWDETCLPARALTLDVETIQELEKVATKADQGLLRDSLGQIIVDIREHVGGVITLPDLRSGTNLDDDTLNSIYSGQVQNLRDAIFDLALLSGRTAAVVRDGKNRTIVHYANTLPDDLKPMVITDASGRVRQTYHYWSDGRGDLVRLRQGDKSYSNVQVHVWERAGSKSAWRTGHAELISCIASAIGCRSGSGWNSVWRALR